MDGGSAASGIDSPPGLSLVMGRGSSASLSPLDHTAPTCSSGPHPRLGPQGCGRSSSTSALLSLPFVRSPSPRQQTTPSHHRLVPAQPVRLRSPIHSRQSQGTGTSPNASGLPRHARHLRGVYPYPDAAQSLPLPRLLVPGPTLLFSRPSLRPQCRPVYFYAGPRVASPLPAGQGDFPFRLLGQHCRLAPGSRHVTGPGTAGYGLSAGYGFPTQPREVTTVSFSVGGLAGRPLVTSDGPLASSFWGSRGDPSRSYGPLAGPLWSPADRSSGLWWGALLQPTLTGSGEWSPEKRVLHVNVLELRAVNESVRYTLVACRMKSLALRQELIALLSGYRRGTWPSKCSAYLRPSTSLPTLSAARGRSTRNGHCLICRSGRFSAGRARWKWTWWRRRSTTASLDGCPPFPTRTPWRWIVAVSTGPPSGPCISSLLRPCFPSCSTESSSFLLGWWWWFPGNPTSRGFLPCFRELSRTFTCARLHSNWQARGPSGTHRAPPHVGRHFLFCGKSWPLDTPAGWSIRCWPHIALLLGGSMTSRGVIFRPGCSLTSLRSPASRCWSFFSICSMWSPSAPARSSVTGLRLSGLFRRLFRSILGTMILVARPRASFTSAIYASSSVGPQWGLTLLRRGRRGDLPSPPCVLQNVVSDGPGCR